jgi:hypothetical protein
MVSMNNAERPAASGGKPHPAFIAPGGRIVDTRLANPTNDDVMAAV